MPTINLKSEINAKRIDVYLSDKLELTRSQITLLVQSGKIKVDGKVITKSGVGIKVGSEIIVELDEPQQIELTPDPSIKIEIIYEDEAIIIINKPAGLTVHPGAGNKHGTLVNALLATHQGALFGDKLRPGIVHRLDKDTSGLMVVAKTAEAYYHLQKQFIPPRTIHRTYLAISASKPSSLDSGIINENLARDPRDRKRYWSSLNGKEAITNWRLIGGEVGRFLFEINLETGRTHQIRAHFAIKNAPLIGDPLYNKNYKKDPIQRQALHSYKLELISPLNKEKLFFKISPPKDFMDLIIGFEDLI